MCVVYSYGVKLLLCCLLLSGKLQNGRKIHPEALQHRTSGFLFQKSKPPENQIMMVGFAAQGQDKSRMGLPEARCPKKASAPFQWKKNRPLLLLLSLQTQIPTNPKGRVAVVQMSPDWEGQRLWRLFRQVGIRQNPDGSVSQRAFAPEGRGSTSTLRYMDATVRRDEGKVVFYQAQK